MKFDVQVTVEETEEFQSWVASHDPEWQAEWEAELMEDANRELLEISAVFEECA